VPDCKDYKLRKGETPLPSIDMLRNRFYLLRHGRSEANESGLIVSDPMRGAQGYGLTALGRDQVEATAHSAWQSSLADSTLALVSSPFLRAQETARIAARIWSVPSIQTDERLRERSCGQFEMAQDESYEQVWTQDRIDPEHRQGGVESVADVWARSCSLVQELDQGTTDTTFILVTHGDVASTLLCGMAQEDFRRHRELYALHTAEIRQVEIKAEMKGKPGCQ
jgi:broad specificity phosphatase PhoE